MAFSIYALIVLLLTVFIICANVLILLVLLRTDMLTLVNRYFFMSLTVSDLCVGLFITPFSFWTSLFDRWIYGEKFCHIQAHMVAIFWIASVYSLMWLSIDHYVAMRKPDRYASIMTRTRCICWVVLLWTAAVSFSFPPIIGISKSRYSAAAYVCFIDWHQQKAYFLTSGLLIVLPPFITLSFANLYIFTDGYQQNKSIYDQCSDSNSSRPDLYIMNVVIGGVYVLSWLPLCSLQIYEAIRNNGGGGGGGGPSVAVAAAEDGGVSMSSVIQHQLHFWLMWLAIGNSFWKFPVYVVCFHDFRTGLRMLLQTRLRCGCSCSC